MIEAVHTARPDESRVLGRGCSSVDVAADGAVTRWQSHDQALPLLVDPAADIPGGAAFSGAVPVSQDRLRSEASACTTLRVRGSVLEVQDWLVKAAEPVGI